MLKNSIKRFGAAGLIAVTVLSVCACGGYTDKSCDWCNGTPSKAYKTSSGEVSYVCKKCSEKCAWCDKKATKHYTNGFDMEVFVCKDCYNEMHND